MRTRKHNTKETIELPYIKKFDDYHTIEYDAEILSEKFGINVQCEELGFSTDCEYIGLFWKEGAKPLPQEIQEELKKQNIIIE